MTYEETVDRTITLLKEASRGDFNRWQRKEFEHSAVSKWILNGRLGLHGRALFVWRGDKPEILPVTDAQRQKLGQIWRFMESRAKTEEQNEKQAMLEKALNEIESSEA
jgi:hypothetical protein